MHSTRMHPGHVYSKEPHGGAVHTLPMLQDEEARHAWKRVTAVIASVSVLTCRLRCCHEHCTRPNCCSMTQAPAGTTAAPSSLLPWFQRAIEQAAPAPATYALPAGAPAGDARPGGHFHVHQRPVLYRQPAAP